MTSARRVTSSALSLALALSLSRLAAAQADPTSSLMEIHINQSCRAVSANGLAVAGVPAMLSAKGFCRLESVKMTQHRETEIVNNNPHRVLATVKEQDYLLQNITDEPIAFIIEHHVPGGWHVDSEPQPVEVSNSTATFRAIAQAGQTVRLHVGMKTTLLGPIPPRQPIIFGAPDIASNPVP